MLEKVQNCFVLSTTNHLSVNDKLHIIPDFVQLVSVSENVDFGNSAKVAKEIND